MSEHGHGHPGHPPPGAHAPELDSEINIGVIRSFVIGLVVLSLFSGVLGYVVSRFLKAQSVKSDPVASPIPEASRERPRPRAALQVNPNADMDAFRAEETKALTSYAWIDQRAGIARIPVDRALEIVADKGLPATSTTSTAVPATVAANPGVLPNDPTSGDR